MAIRWIRYSLATALFLCGTLVVIVFNLGSERFHYTVLLSRIESGGDPPEETATCSIPQLDPWDEAVKKYVKRPKPYSCPKPSPLTRLSIEGKPLITMDSSLAGSYGKAKDGELKCCASVVTRGKVVSEKDKRADQSYSFQKCRPFNESITMDSDFVLVECKRGKKTVYTDMHAAAVPTRRTERKMAEASRPLPPSVLLLGIDSSSRMNIHRAAPKLVQTLRDIGAVELTAYNKVGDNTLPNLLPILTGVSLPDANNRSTKESNGVGCWPNNNYTFDKCPFIWKNLSSKGYVTMFGEDEPSISIFNYHKLGFREQPTDHYLRPFFVVAEKRLQKTKRGDSSWCYANKATLTRILDYVRSFVGTYVGRAPFFSLVFITGISHHDAADLQLSDSELSQFVRQMANLSDSESGGGGMMLAVFSDHGMRWGSLRQSPFGWMEERVPFLFIRPPLKQGSVEALYPKLLQNRNRLASPFDFHFTLHALLYGTRPSWSSCRKCFDLLHEAIPLGRTCEDAAIPAKWCACADEEESKASEEDSWRAASVAVDHLNQALSSLPQCSQLTFASMVSARYRLLPTGKGKKGLKLMMVTFTTSPGDAIFEATLKVDKNGTYHISSELSRLNQYGNQSWCVDNAESKLYCYCL